MNKLFFLECLRSILFLKFLKYCMAFVLSFYAGSYQSIYEANAASIPKSRRWKCVVPWATLLRKRMKSEERQRERERESLRKRERIRQKERKRKREILLFRNMHAMCANVCACVYSCTCTCFVRAQRRYELRRNRKMK